MRRQTATADEDLVGPVRCFRIDPATLPVRYSAPIGKGARRVEAVIVLDREQAIVRRPSLGGVPLTFRLPVKTFEGVAVAMTPIGEDGDIEVMVELRHRDPALSVPLAVAEDPGEISADWQAWGRTLGLPLLIVGLDGTVEKPVDRIGPLLRHEPKPRRRHSFFAGRRPRFLTRRKTGLQGSIEILSAREIIARD